MLEEEVKIVRFYWMFSSLICTNIDSDEESEDDENLDEDPTIEHINVNHQGGVNRIRNMPQHAGMVATMADTGKVHIYDLHASVTSMFQKVARVAPPNKPVFTFSGHRDEGFALDWSLASAGRLATGDCAGGIHVWNPSAGGTHWQVDATPFRGHEGSVEDIQWSPTEGTVFASCSSDKTVRIWDTRDKTKPQITWQAHSEDVNVISWNRTVGFLLASGSDDSSFKVNLNSLIHSVFV
jgi:ribosome assembly protein RRB1